MASFVQGNSAVWSTSTSGTAVTLTGTTAGNFLVIWTSYFVSGQSISSFTCNNATLFPYGATPIWDSATAPGAHLVFYSGFVTSSGTSTITVNVTGTIAGAETFICEYSGITNPAFVTDGRVSNETVSTVTTVSSGALTTTKPSSLLVWGYSNNTTLTSLTPSGAVQRIYDVGNACGVADYVTPSAGTYTLTGQQVASGFIGIMASFQAISSVVSVNATLSIHAVATFTPHPRQLNEGKITCSGTATFHGVSAAALNKQLIVIGRATFAATSKVLRNANNSFTGHAAIVQRSTQLNNADLNLTGAATVTQGGFANSIPVNATIIIRAFTGAPPILNVGGSARVIMAGQVNFTLPHITFNGRATQTLRGTLLNSATLSILGRATVAPRGTVAGAIVPVFNQIFLSGRVQSFVQRSTQLNNARIVIQAGILSFVPQLASISIRGRASFVGSAIQFNNAKLSILGTATTKLSPFISGSPTINGRVSIQGTATFRVALASIPVNGSVSFTGRAFPGFGAFQTIGRLGKSLITGRATTSFRGFVLGGVFNNADLTLAGNATLRAGASLLNNVVFAVFGSASLRVNAGVLNRSTLSIQGTATTRFATPRQTITFVSGHVLQYKVWQYPTENMVRCMGSTWTVTSVGMSFQSVAVELVMTEAGWGN